MDNKVKLERIEDLKKAILEAEKMKVWNTWEELNDELEDLEEEVEHDTKLALAQKKWDEMSEKDKKLYPNRPKTYEDIEILKVDISED
ncbi:MAG: hypothetical protein WCO33_01470 [bacterium]